MTLQEPQKEFSLTFRVDRLEEHHAVLAHEAVGELRWPMHLFPENLRPGQTVTVKLDVPDTADEKPAAQRTENVADWETKKRLLEELING